MYWQILVLLLVFSNSAVGASTDPLGTWSAGCQAASGDFHLNFTSTSGEWDKDDESITLNFADGKTLALPLKSALFKSRATLSNVKNLCDKVASLDVGQDRILFMLSRDGRPGWDHLDVALIDIRRRIVLDVKTDIGLIKTKDPVFALRSAGQNSFEVRLIREEIKNSDCDCEAAAIEDWMRIGIEKGKVQTKWTRPF